MLLSKLIALVIEHVRLHSFIYEINIGNILLSGLKIVLFKFHELKLTFVMFFP